MTCRVVQHPGANVVSLAAARQERAECTADRPIAFRVTDNAGWYQDRIVRHRHGGWQGTVLGQNRFGKLVVEVSCGEYRAAWPAEVDAPLMPPEDAA